MGQGRLLPITVGLPREKAVLASLLPSRGNWKRNFANVFLANYFPCLVLAFLQGQLGGPLRRQGPNQQPQHLWESCLLASVPG